MLKLKRKNRRIHGVFRAVHDREELPSEKYRGESADDAVRSRDGDQLQKQPTELAEVLKVILSETRRGRLQE